MIRKVKISEILQINQTLDEINVDKLSIMAQFELYKFNRKSEILIDFLYRKTSNIKDENELSNLMDSEIYFEIPSMVMNEIGLSDDIKAE